ncbi:acyl-CoA dehydrogenase family protein [Mycolicibacter kumamotonensis]|uniref:Acyl-CoA/acyl-ACP dehydrogenase n=1 Tax=Mycolicibacter kumamotonensis TaxID=354243 RepID=A0A7K3LG94_9MYCO|nr:acyl-CoA dehydrogenase family protein [Mycolicibacter kumamotonensis]NDJ91353.1 acyl-CoA/acyl-ACP dehydrogenase [Mycolicibacter kumamotonensis]
MDFGLTGEQLQLADAERSWLGRHDPITRVRAALDSAPITIDPAAVAHAAESGLLALLTPDAGGTHLDLAVLSEIHGSAASSLPLADLVIGAWLLAEAGLPEANPAGDGDLLVGLARGQLATTSGSTVRLRGTTSAVPMAADMARFAVVGLTDDGAEYLAVVRDPERIVMSTLDLTRSWTRLRLNESVETWARLPVGTISKVRDALAVHRALDALGGAARLLDLTVSYAGQREQFGAPIGSFQAVKHHCADMAVGVEAGRSALWAAAMALDGAPSNARSRAASAGAAYAKSAASRVAGTALQVHGGIGFTWEHDLHLFLRRIKVDQAFDGTVAEHRAALVAT